MPKANFVAAVDAQNLPVIPPMEDSEGGLQLRFDTGENVTVLNNDLEEITVDVIAGGWCTISQPIDGTIVVQIKADQATIDALKADTDNYIFIEDIPEPEE